MVVHARLRVMRKSRPLLPKWESFSILSEAQGTLGKRKQKELQSQRMGRSVLKQCLLNMTGLVCYELTTSVVLAPNYYRIEPATILS